MNTAAARRWSELLMVACAAIASCKPDTKSEEAAVSPTPPAPRADAVLPSAAALRAQLPGLRGELAACKDRECQVDVKARSIQLANDALLERCAALAVAEVAAALEEQRRTVLPPSATYDTLARAKKRCERSSDRLSVAASSRPEGILRDALEAKLLEAADFSALTGKQPDAVEPAGALDVKLPTKRETVESLLDRGSALVHIDARREGVSVPPEHQVADLVLRFGREMTPPVPDLVVDDGGISATLSFSGKPFHCVVPWTAIYGAVLEGEPITATVWSEDAPDDIVASAARAALVK